MLIRATVGQSDRTMSNYTPVLIPCMHDGCELEYMGEHTIYRGAVKFYHDEGDDFKMPRGFKVACQYCKKNGPPDERGAMYVTEKVGQDGDAGIPVNFDVGSIVAVNVRVSEL